MTKKTRKKKEKKIILKNKLPKKIEIFLLVIPKHWGGNFAATGVSPKWVKSRRHRKKKKRRKEKK